MPEETLEQAWQIALQRAELSAPDPVRFKLQAGMTMQQVQPLALLSSPQPCASCELCTLQPTTTGSGY